MERRPDIRALIVFAALAGLLGLIVGIAGSWVLGVSIGLITLALGLAISVWGPGRSAGGDADPGRRNLLVAAGLGGLAWAVAGPSVGWAARKLGRPDPRPVQEAMATGLGSEYMELVRRTFIPRRSGDLQLLLAPVQQLELPAGIALARAAGPADEPCERLDVPRADPPRRARPRAGRRRATPSSA